MGWHVWLSGVLQWHCRRLAQQGESTSLTCRWVELKEVNSGLYSTTVVVNLEIQTVSHWLWDARVPLTASVSCGSGALTPVLLGGQPVAQGFWSCAITSLLGDLSSPVLKVITAPKTQLWQESSQGCSGQYWQVTWRSRRSPGMLAGGIQDDLWGLWGSRPTTSYLEAAPRALHPPDSSGDVSCDPWA